MGAYLSVPVTEKISLDDKNESISYGASSMQGWRVSQEDAHNAILDYDEDTTLFAVYDGHGGEEVSQYTAENFPPFLIDCLKKYDKIEECLQKAFLEFDLSLIKPDILTIIKDIAKSKSVEEDDDESEEREDLENLRKEATMPIEKVIQLYGEKKFISPNLRPKRDLLEEGCSSVAGSSGLSKCELSVSSQDSSDEDKHSSEASSSNVINISLKKEVPSAADLIVNGESNKKVVCDIKPSELVNGDNKNLIDDYVKKKSCDSISDVENYKLGNESVPKDSTSVKDSSNVSVKDNDPITKDNETSSKSLDSNENSEKNNSRTSINSVDNKQLNISNSLSNENSNCSSNEVDSSNNNNQDEVQSKKGGKGTGHSKGKNNLTYAELVIKKNLRVRKNCAAIYSKLCHGDSLTDSDDFDSDEDSETDQMNDSSDEEMEDMEEECEEEHLEEEAEEEDEAVYGCGYADMNSEEPCYDSGCTACVALIRNNKLYVANVGDSRCVLYRGGKAIDMSIDHKPEDDIETERIIKAGGQITEDGRVNGGLNLSRALGDHRYKMNKTIKHEEQMISALPDVQIQKLSDEDEFLVIACDGIWNSLTSDEVCAIVDERLKENTKLSKICEELFDCCIAPNTEGDGTGCDNMTCIIAKFHHKKLVDVSSLKRPIDDSLDEDLRLSKHPKIYSS